MGGSQLKGPYEFGARWRPVLAGVVLTAAPQVGDLDHWGSVPGG